MRQEKRGKASNEIRQTPDGEAESNTTMNQMCFQFCVVMMCCGFFFAVGVKDLAVYMAVFADAAGKSAAGADDETETPVAGVKDDDLALHPYKDDDYRNPN